MNPTNTKPTLQTEPNNTDKPTGQRLVCTSLYIHNDAARIFGAAAGQERYFWATPQADLTLVGMGVAAECSAWGEERFTQIQEQCASWFANMIVLDPNLPESALPKAFGGFAFHPHFLADYAWTDFKPCQLVLPHLQFAQTEPNGGWLTLSAVLEDNACTQAHFAALRAALAQKIAWLEKATLATHPLNQPNQPEKKVASIHYPLSAQSWEKLVQQVLDAIQNGRVEKAVLCRVAEMHFAENTNMPTLVNNALDNLQQDYADCYRFAFQPKPTSAFVGASPERLVKLDTQGLHSVALAGSCPRGATLEQDQALRQALLASAKNLHEHKLVVRSLQATLASLAEQVETGTTTVLPLRNIQHLMTPLQTQNCNQNVVGCLAELHPTPALGGLPKQPSLELIAEVEHLPRGWYASPIGYVDHLLNGEFCVGIRSAVLQHTRAWLYAGCGIVQGSDAVSEWEETALKLRPMLEALV